MFKKQLLVLIATCSYFLCDKGMEGNSNNQYIVERSTKTQLSLYTEPLQKPIGSPSTQESTSNIRILKAREKEKQTKIVAAIVLNEEINRLNFKDINFWDPRYNATPLTIAAERGFRNIVKHILKLCQQEKCAQSGDATKVQNYIDGIETVMLNNSQNEQCSLYGTLHRLAASQLIPESTAAKIAQQIIDAGAHVALPGRPSIRFDYNHYPILIALARSWNTFAMTLHKNFALYLKKNSHNSKNEDEIPSLEGGNIYTAINMVSLAVTGEEYPFQYKDNQGIFIASGQEVDTLLSNFFLSGGCISFNEEKYAILENGSLCAIYPKGLRERLEKNLPFFAWTKDPFIKYNYNDYTNWAESPTHLAQALEEEKENQKISYTLLNQFDRFKDRCPTFQDINFWSRKFGCATLLTLAAERGMLPFVDHILFLLKKQQLPPEDLQNYVNTNDNTQHYCIAHRLATSPHISEKMAIQMFDIINHVVPVETGKFGVESSSDQRFSHIPALIAHARGWNKLAQKFAEESKSWRSHTPKLISKDGDPLLQALDCLSWTQYNRPFRGRAEPQPLESLLHVSHRQIYEDEMAKLVHNCISNGRKIIKGYSNRYYIETFHNGTSLSILYGSLLALSYQALYPFEALKYDPQLKANYPEYYNQYTEFQSDTAEQPKDFKETVEQEKMEED